jgi:hypothetical protein
LGGNGHGCVDEKLSPLFGSDLTREETDTRPIRCWSRLGPVNDPSRKSFSLDADCPEWTEDFSEFPRFGVALQAGAGCMEEIEGQLVLKPIEENYFRAPVTKIGWQVEPDSQP